MVQRAPLLCLDPHTPHTIDWERQVVAFACERRHDSNGTIPTVRCHCHRRAQAGVRGGDERCGATHGGSSRGRGWQRQNGRRARANKARRRLLAAASPLTTPRAHVPRPRPRSVEQYLPGDVWGCCQPLCTRERHWAGVCLVLRMCRVSARAGRGVWGCGGVEDVITWPGHVSMPPVRIRVQYACRDKQAVQHTRLAYSVAPAHRVSAGQLDVLQHVVAVATATHKLAKAAAAAAAAATAVGRCTAGRGSRGCRAA